MLNGHSNMHGSYVWGGGGGGFSDFCVTYYLTQTYSGTLLGQYVMFDGHSNMHGSYVWGRGGGGLVTFV